MIAFSSRGASEIRGLSHLLLQIEQKMTKSEADPFASMASDEILRCISAAP